MNSSSFKGIIVLIIGGILAIMLGQMAATDQVGAATWVAGGVCLAVCLAMGRRIWMVVPVVVISNLTLRWVPGNLTLLQIALVLMVTFTTLMIALRKVRLSFRPRAIDIWAGILLLCVAQVYMRNPVGLSFAGASNVGGRPYVEFALAFVVYLYLSSMKVPVHEFLTIRRLAIGLGIFTVLAQFVAYLPGMALPMTILLGTGNLNITGEVANPNSADAGRNMAGQSGARVIPRIVVGCISPIASLTRPFWALVILFSIACALLSGFRGSIIYAGAIYLIGTWFWSGRRFVVLALAAGAVSVALLAGINSVAPLPAKFQRALSFLPGTWEDRYVEAAEGSTEWRLEIWQEALFTDEWIKNKVFGDGLGFTAEELAMQESIAMREELGLGGGGVSGGAGSLGSHQETVLVNGDYHSGPVSMIRTIGWVGMILFVFALIALALRAAKIMRAYRRTKYFPTLAFFCIPIVLHPFWFLFVIGGFGKDAPQFLLGLGLLNLFMNSLPSPRACLAEEAGELPDAQPVQQNRPQQPWRRPPPGRIPGGGALAHRHPQGGGPQGV